MARRKKKNRSPDGLPRLAWLRDNLPAGSHDADLEDLFDRMSGGEMDILIDLFDQCTGEFPQSLGEFIRSPKAAGALAGISGSRWNRLRRGLERVGRDFEHSPNRIQPETSLVPDPPARLAGLEAWIAEHGERAWLSHPMEKLRPFLETAVSFHAHYGLPAGPIRDALSGWGLRKPWRSGPGLETLQVAARGYLRFLANRRKLAALRESRWSRPLEGPRLERAARILKRALADALRSRSARDPILFDEVALQFSTNPAGVELCFKQGRRIYLQTVDIRIDLEFDAGEELNWRCDCGHAGPDPCRYLRCTLEWLLDWLYDPGSPRHRALADLLEKPGWQRLVERTRQILTEQEQEDPQPESRLAWRLGHREPGDRLQLVPVLCTRTKTGRFGRGRVIQLLDALDQEAITDQDRQVISALALGNQRDPHGFNQQAFNDSLGEALLALTGHPRVFRLDAPGEPLRVRRAPPVVALRREEAGVRARLRLGGSSEGIGQFPGLMLGDRVLCRLDPDRGECLVAGLDRRAVRLLLALSDNPVAVPPEGLDEFLDLLGRSQPDLLLEVPDELAGPPVEAGCDCRLRLSPLGETGLEARLLVRPAPEAPAFPPGTGPARLYLNRGGRRFHLDRDLSRERGQAEETAGRLGLSNPGGRLDWHWRIADPEQALALVAAAADLGDDLPVEWPEGETPWRAVTVTPANVRVRVRRERDWFGVSGEVEVDGEVIPLADLLGGLRRGERFVRLGPGRFARLSEELKRRFGRLDRATHRHGKRLGAGPAGAREVSEALEGLEVDCDEHWRSLLERMQGAGRLRPRVPATLDCTLRRYQAEGYRWLARLSAWAGGACLADDMGLGKTVQTLALLLRRAREGPALVVAPTSVLSVWKSEARRFAPGLEVRLYHGPDRQGLLAGLGPDTLLLTSYDVAARDAEAFGPLEFHTLVLDEAQAVKNSRSQRAKAIRKIRAGFRLALTGTPLENHLGELWSVFRAIDPGLLGPWTHFRERFAAPIERHGDTQRLQRLSEYLRPFLLRRTKSQVAPELPPRTEVVRPVFLSDPERRLYRREQETAVEQIASREDDRFALLSAITRLRRLACHPRLVDPDCRVRSSKLEAALRVITGRLEQGERALVFSQFTSHLALIRTALDAQGAGYLYLDGSTPAAEREQLVRRWAGGESDLFLISLKAGGFGLNLTGADCVVHLDPWWNPAVEDQATDRTHRIGQSRPVTVVRLIAQDTIEQAVLDLHTEKRALARGLLEGADQAARLSAEELMGLIAYGS